MKPPSAAVEAVIAERRRQDEKWGQQDHEPLTWLAILAEEVGEAGREALNVTLFASAAAPDWTLADLTPLRGELVQCAAVAVAAVEALDRLRPDDSAPVMEAPARLIGEPEHIGAVRAAVRDAINALLNEQPHDEPAPAWESSTAFVVVEHWTERIAAAVLDSADLSVALTRPSRPGREPAAVVAPVEPEGRDFGAGCGDMPIAEAGDEEEDRP